MKKRVQVMEQVECRPVEGSVVSIPRSLNSDAGTRYYGFLLLLMFHSSPSLAKMSTFTGLVTQALRALRLSDIKDLT